MTQHYDASRKATLLQRCHRLFLDCVDHSSSNFEKILKAFDFYSQIYCSKFEEGQMDDKEQEEYDRIQSLGIYKMVADIHDETYTTPLMTLKQRNQKSTVKRNEEVNHVLWWVAAVVIGILTFLYILGLYFTYFDDPKEFERTFRNNLE